MTISEIAQAVGLSSKTIRYYERIGLIAPPLRNQNGYRCYADASLGELRFIKQAREAGFNLEECRALRALYLNEHRQSAEVKALAQEKVLELRQRIAELTAMLNALEPLVQCCHGDERAACPILDNLAKRGSHG